MFARFISFIKSSFSRGYPATRFGQGALLGSVLVLIASFFTAGYYFLTGIPQLLMGLLFAVIGAFSLLFVWFFAGMANQLLRKSPTSLILSAVVLLVVSIGLNTWLFGWPDTVFYPIILIGLLAGAAFAGSLAMSLKSTGPWKYLLLAASSLGVLVLIIWVMVSPGWFDATPEKVIGDQPPFALENPALPGQYSVDYKTYGSGTDKHRAAFGSEATWLTDSVDARLIIPEWTGKKAKWRKKFWGFGAEAFPINGRIWLPDKEGLLPIVMIVHGNHSMEDFSDEGYSYLTELLASQGNVAVSMDENFINGTWSGDFRGREMPARAWLLLKHLEVLRAWNDAPNHPLYNRLDLSNVVLIGHSRGGEAVAIAALYNQLARFPDNAKMNFNFNFGIKGIISIAPTDKRYFRRVALENINYLSLQGSYDSDESSFFGIRQYQRVTFTDTLNHFKAGLYIHNANHGQFNTSWGTYDAGGVFRWLLNVAPLISGEEQRNVAKVYVGAFVHDAFKKPIYSEIFKRAEVIKDWLPATLFFTNYQNSKNEILVDFEDDVDVLTAKNSAVIHAENLVVWREEKTQFRDKDFRGTNAAVLGWRTDSVGIGSYKVNFEPSVYAEEGADIVLVLASGDLKELKLPDSTYKQEKDQHPIFTMIVTYENSIQTKLIGAQGDISPPLQIQFAKTKFLSEDWGALWEPVFSSFYYPVQQNDSIKSIELQFDKSQNGVLMIDQISLQPGQ